MKYYTLRVWEPEEMVLREAIGHLAQDVSVVIEEIETNSLIDAFLQLKDTAIKVKENWRWKIQYSMASEKLFNLMYDLKENKMNIKIFFKLRTYAKEKNETRLRRT